VEGLVILAANFLVAVGKILDIILTIYMYIIIARALISWVNPDPYNPIVSFLYRVTEPVLYRIRKRLPSMGGLDLSPLIVLLIIFFLQKFAVNSILDLGYRMKLGLGGFP
jgi:YggT family protein